jgi:hypothetical protein
MEREKKPEHESSQARAGDEEDSSADARLAAARQRRMRQRRTESADAETFNRRHPDQVDEFNRLTANLCVAEGGLPDVESVKKWQTEHGLDPDGKIGKRTIAAAGGKTKPEDETAAGAKEGDNTSDARDRVGHGPSAKPQTEGVDEYDLLPFIDPPKLGEVIEQAERLLKLALQRGPQEGGQASGASLRRPDPAGIASGMAVGHFVDAVHRVKSEWPSLSVVQRMAAVVDAANQQLSAADVLPALLQVEEMDALKVGEFVSESWQMKMNRKPYDREQLSPTQAKEIADGVYHETRHAEQNHKVARYLAGRGMTIEEIHGQMSIAGRAAQHAHARPLREGEPGAKQAKAFFDDKMGAGKEHHAEVMATNREWLQRYRVLRDQYDSLVKAGAPKSEVKHAHAELLRIKEPVMKAYSEYRKLPMEADAFSTGGQAGSAYGKKHEHD